MSEDTSTSRIPGFYKLPLHARAERIAEGIGREGGDYLRKGGGLSPHVADGMSENVVATMGLPLSVALNFRVNGQDVRVPMAVEEPSVVAAASNAARLIRTTGGFRGEADPSVMTAQVHLYDVPKPQLGAGVLETNLNELGQLVSDSIPRMVARGGGFRGAELRVLDEQDGLCVVHLYIDVLDAMGANLVDTVAEAVAPQLAEWLGGKVGLRILSNLPERRMVRVSASVSEDAIGGAELAAGIARASRFAELDPYRAVTHNKGILNGVDAVALALGQDWRSIEAGAHGYAATREGGYAPLATWRHEGGALRGEIELPLAVGTVGGSTRSHPGVRAAFEILGIERASELAIVMAAAGLASNLAALKALAGEGIQKGHMRLHHRKQFEAAEAASRKSKEVAT